MQLVDPVLKNFFIKFGFWQHDQEGKMLQLQFVCGQFSDGGANCEFNKDTPCSS